MPTAEKQIEVRPQISELDAKKLDAVALALTGVVNRKGAAELIIHYGVNNMDAVLSWFGKRASEETAKVG